MAKFILYSNYLLFVAVQYLVFCFQTHAVPYDHSYPTGCYQKPQAPQYDGGLIANSALNYDQGMMGGQPKVPLSIVAGTHYTISAWLQISHTKANIAGVLKTETEDITIGWAMAQNGCWSMLKGGLTAKTSGPAELYFTANNTEVFSIRADSISVQPFSNEEWTSHRLSNIEKVRKNNVRVQVMDKAGRPVPNATVSLTQTRGDFPFGCAINSNIIQYLGYRKWFLQRFNGRYTVFENELKWYSTEPVRGMEDYSAADALFTFAESNGIKIRGHNIYWDSEPVQQSSGTNQPRWLLSLSGEELLAAVHQRMQSVMTKYAGRVIQWDVSNEALHGNFFESRLNDPAATAKFFQMAHSHDPTAIMFMNDFNTIECPQDASSSPQAYVQKIAEMRSQGLGAMTVGVGLESHFTDINLPSIRASLDYILNSGAGPIWITELDVKSGPYGLAEVLQEFFAHHGVEGVMLWNAWSPDHCYVNCLTDNNFHNLPAGDVVDSFLGNLTHNQDSELRGRTTDSNGFVQVSLHHGDYKLKIRSPTAGRFRRYSIKRIKVQSNQTDTHVHRVTIHHRH